MPTRGLLFVDTSTLINLANVGPSALNALNATGRQIVVVTTVRDEIHEGNIANTNYEAWRQQHQGDGTIRDVAPFGNYQGADAGERAIREVAGTFGIFTSDVLIVIDDNDGRNIASSGSLIPSSVAPTTTVGMLSSLVLSGQMDYEWALFLFQLMAPLPETTFLQDYHRPNIFSIQQNGAYAPKVAEATYWNTENPAAGGGAIVYFTPGNNIRVVVDDVDRVGNISVPKVTTYIMPPDTKIEMGTGADAGKMLLGGGAEYTIIEQETGRVIHLHAGEKLLVGPDVAGLENERIVSAATKLDHGFRKIADEGEDDPSLDYGVYYPENENRPGVVPVSDQGQQYETIRVRIYTPQESDDPEAIVVTGAREIELVVPVGQAADDLRNALLQATRLDADGQPYVDGNALATNQKDALERNTESAAAIGRMLGSALSRALQIEDPWASLGASSLLGTLGQNIAQELKAAAYAKKNPTKTPITDGFENFPDDLLSSGIGAIGSYLLAEWVANWGLGEFGTGAVNSAGGAVISKIASNIIDLKNGVEGAAWNKDIFDVANLKMAAGGFIGSFLASKLVKFDTISGQIGAAFGSGIGSLWIGGAMAAAASAGNGVVLGMQLGSWAGPLGAAIGAFFGYIFGGIIGSIVKTGNPRSGATFGWDESSQKFKTLSSWSKNKGSREAAISFSETIAGVLNNVINASGAKLINAQAITGEYGTYKEKFVHYDQHGIAYSTSDLNDLIDAGAFISLSDMLQQMVGGDTYVKRAVATTLARSGGNATQAGQFGSFSVGVLAGNLAVARDYSLYLQTSGMINLLIGAASDGAFSAGWIVTLAQAVELGLDKRSEVDWIGGWSAFFDEAKGGKIDGQAFLPINLTLSLDPVTKERHFAFGDDLGLLGVFFDTIDTASKTLVAGTSGNDVITVDANNLITSTSGVAIGENGANGYTIRVAAYIDAGDGDDWVEGGDLGNDLLGGAGNDTLIGGKLDDWIFGGAGNDTLYASAGGLAAPGNGDLLDGGEGNDTIFGSLGSDWLKGGAGSDALAGGAGGDILDVGEGNDATAEGGAGSDQYVFNFGYGQDVIYDSAAGGPGASSDDIFGHIAWIGTSDARRNWAGDGTYSADGSVKGGEDAIVFGAGIDMRNVVAWRDPGTMDLVIELMAQDETTHEYTLTGDSLRIVDWFNSTSRVEWLRFANGDETRLADYGSFRRATPGDSILVGTNRADFLVGDEHNNALYGLRGNDYGVGGRGDDFISGDENEDFLLGGGDSDEVVGGAGDDTAFGDGGSDRVYGGTGSDIVVGGRGDDIVVGGADNDIFRYWRGDGADVLIDDYVDHWEQVFHGDLASPNGIALDNGYAYDSNSNVWKDGVRYFDGLIWRNGPYDYAYASNTMRRWLGPVGGVVARDDGQDSLEFGAGINLQDIEMRANGVDLDITIRDGEADATAFADISDRITVKDWYAIGASIETFVFVATGAHDMTAISIAQNPTDGADTINGGDGRDWITAMGGDDVVDAGGGDDIVTGGQGNDRIRGGSGVDVLYGQAGADVLDGGGEGDQLLGGAGIDLASYASGGAGVSAYLASGEAFARSRDAKGDVYTDIEGVEGTSGGDRLGGDSGQNILRGLAGNDRLVGGGGDDTYEIELNGGKDVIFEGLYTLKEIIDGAANTNLATLNSEFAAVWTPLGVVSTISGDRQGYRLTVTHIASGTEVYRSRDNIDFLYTSTHSTPPPAEWPFSDGQWRNGAGRTGNGVQAVWEMPSTGNGGDDSIQFGEGISLADLTFTRSGGDLRIGYQNGHAVTIAGQTDADRAIESIVLSDGMTASLGHLRINGETASDQGDLVVGDTGADTLSGLAGNDILSGAAGDDILHGGDGDDVLEGGAGGDTLDGGSDSLTEQVPISPTSGGFWGDIARFVRSQAGVNVDLAAKTASGGDAQNDVIVADANGVATIEHVMGSQSYGDTLSGDARANRLFGLGGLDVLDGREGDDVLVGGDGDDVVLGGAGDDNLAGEDGADVLHGDSGADLISAGAGDDIAYGGDGNDQIGGDDGADTLYGEAGDDALSGGAGADLLSGGVGADTLSGGAGNDTLSGGGDNDTYVFDATSGADAVIDTDGTRNKLVFSGVTSDRLWITRLGDDLRVGVIGGAATVTVAGYYASSSPGLVREVATETGSLFLAYSGPLIGAMTTQSSAVTPTAMPTAIRDMLGLYWHPDGTAAPLVTNQTLETDEDTSLAGAVNAVDHDENITGYTIEMAPEHGDVELYPNGTWTYTPDDNWHGADAFTIKVTDADGHIAEQIVAVTVHSLNDAPTDVIRTGGATSLPEWNRPQAGAEREALFLGNLSAADVDLPTDGDFAVHTFTIDEQISRFYITGGNQLYLKASADIAALGLAELDFETAQTVSVTVTARDRNGSGESFAKIFTFNIADGEDYAYGTTNADALTGQSGRDLIYGYGGNDTLAGGAGDDSVEGGEGADIISGGDGADQIYGEAGNDTLAGGAGADQIYGDAGNDALSGGDGADQLSGGADDDILEGGAGADTFTFGDGIDTLSYSNAASGVTLSLATGGAGGEAAGDVFTDAPEIVIGSAYADSITGSVNGDKIHGGAGADTLHGGAGEDWLYGDDGDDFIYADGDGDYLEGGAGADHLEGGLGSDHYIISETSGDDIIVEFDPDGTSTDDLSVVNVDPTRLWFERIGDDLKIGVIGGTASANVVSWFSDDPPPPVDRTLEMVFATPEPGQDLLPTDFGSGQSVDVEGLVALMANPAYVQNKPTTINELNDLLADPAYLASWKSFWNPNEAPVVATIDPQTTPEDTALTIDISASDDWTPAQFLTYAVKAYSDADAQNEIVGGVTCNVVIDANGQQRLTVTPQDHFKGDMYVRLSVTDLAHRITDKIFKLVVSPVVDGAEIIAQPVFGNSASAGFTDLPLGIDLGRRDDAEAWEEISIEIPQNLYDLGLRLDRGSYQGDGKYILSEAEAQSAKLIVPAGWSADLLGDDRLKITAITRESDDATKTEEKLQEVRINAPPGYVSASLSISEGTAENPIGADVSVGTLTATDADGNAITYDLTDNDGGRFYLLGTTIFAVPGAAIDYEQATAPAHSRTIKVRAKDTSDLEGPESTLTVSVINVNERPGLPTSGGLSIAENSANGSIVGAVTSIDPDGTNPTYSLTNSAGGRFQINATTGVVTVANSSTLDYDSLPANQKYFTIGVRASDGVLDRDQNFNVAIQNVEEAPIVTSFSTTGHVVYDDQYNANSPVPLAQLNAADPEGGQLTYHLADTHDNKFSVTPSGLVTAIGTFDYESISSYQLGVYATDPTGQSTPTQYFWIDITNLNEAPYVTWAQYSYTTWHGQIRELYMGFGVADPDGDAISVGYTLNPWHNNTNLYQYAQDQYQLTSLVGNTVATTFTIGMTDAHGLGRNTYFYWSPPSFSWAPPIVLDLDGDGVSLISIDEGITFDHDGDGRLDTTGWVAPSDAFLVIDRNGDGQITTGAEIGFVSDVDFAVSDFEGLRAFDTNANGVFEAGDDQFAAFRVWQDVNQNAVSDPGELTSLAARGIVGIELGLTLTDESLDGATDNVVYGTARVMRADGSVGLAGDVALAYVRSDAAVLVTNQAPLSISLADGALTTSENSADGTVLATFAALDLNANDSASFSLVDDAGGRFLLSSSGALSVGSSAALNYESATSHQIVVRVTDSGGLTYDKAFTVTLTDANEAPTNITLASGSLTLPENSANGTVLGTVAGADPDAGDSAAYTLTDNAGGRFAISSAGQLSVANGGLLNFEAAGSHDIIIRVTDAGGLTYDKTFTVSLSNVNEAPTDIALTSGGLIIAENSANGTVLGSFGRTDPDASDGATYSLTNNAGGRFAISNSGQLTVADGSLLVYNTATSHQVTIRVADAGGLTYDKTFTITLSNVNEAPTDITLASGSLSLAENSANATVLGTFGRIDPDAGDSATYSLTNDAGGRFALSSAGLLTVANAALLNYEAATSHQITVRVTDSGGLSFDKAFTITLTNVNEAPTDIALASGSLTLAENSANGAVLGAFSRADVDAGDSATYSLTDNAGARFAISSAGQLSVASGALLNYEAATSHQITVRVTDAGGLTYDKTFTVNLSNVNEAPTDISLASGALSIAENSANGASLGTFARTDADSGDSATYTLTDNAGGRFAISSSGQLTVANGSLLNYEAATSHQITVRATDAGGLYYNKTFSVGVSNVNEAPTSIAADRTLAFYENTAAGTGLAWFSTTDPDGGTFTYSLTNNAGGRFSIDSNGLLKAGSTNVNYEATTGNWITVRSTDSGGLYKDQSFYVSANDANEAPYLTNAYITAAFYEWYDWDYDGNITYVSGYNYYLTMTAADPEGHGVNWYVSHWHEYGDGGTSAQDSGPVNSFDNWLWGSWNYNNDYGIYNIWLTDVYGAQHFTQAGIWANGYDLYTVSWSPPVVLDLDGDGVTLRSLANNPVAFDQDGDGHNNKSGWVGANDGLLVYDRNADGAITYNEMSFVADSDFAVSDLEGMRAYDTNQNGAFDIGDEKFATFRVWRDANGDAVVQSGELMTLESLDITSIDLNLTLTGQTTDGATDNVIYATSSFTRSDGTTGQVGDVMLAWERPPEVEVQIIDGGQPPAESPDTPVARITPAPIAPEPITYDPSQPYAEAADALRRAIPEHRLRLGDNDWAADEAPSAPPAPAPEQSEPAQKPSRRAAALDQPSPAAEDGSSEQVDWTPYQDVAAGPGALDAQLASVNRQRLQMVQAMAGFDPKGSTQLALRDRRHVDGATLALLTSTSDLRMTF